MLVVVAVPARIVPPVRRLARPIEQPTATARTVAASGGDGSRSTLATAVHTAEPTSGRLTAIGMATGPTAATVAHRPAVARTFALLWLVLASATSATATTARSVAPGEAGFHVQSAAVRRLTGTATTDPSAHATTADRIARADLGLVHERVDRRLILGRCRLYRVGRRVLRRGGWKREQVLAGLARLHLGQLVLWVLRAGERASPRTAGRDRFGRVAQPGQWSVKVWPADLW